MQQRQSEAPASRLTPGKTQSMEWRCIGPHRGGRVVAVAGDPSEPATFYFGACAGGVWKTADGGQYWENVSDGFFATSAVGAIAVAESDPNVIYAGTGETAIRGNVSHGDGVYKSTDAGKTWKNMGLVETRHIGEIQIHPSNPDIVYVAALGHAFGSNPERGVYRSTDGGKSWEKVLFRSDNAGAVDISLDPRNPRIVYASIWQARRTFWSLNSGGPECGLFKSSDGGDTWEELTRNPGLPKGTIGKIGVAVSPARSGRVYAIVEAEDGAVFRSDDGGATWQRLSEQGGLRWRAWYYMHIYADPLDPDTVWVLNGECFKSIDGGKSFSAVPTPHGDNHALWIDPKNPMRMIEGNDGGACVTYNGGGSWSSIFNQPTAQFYHVVADTQIPYRVYGSQQDNSAISVPSMSVNGAIGESEWYVPGGGESGYLAVRPDNPNIVFGGAIGSGEGNGRLLRYDHRTGHIRNVTVWPMIQGMGNGAKDLKYRFQWTFPIILSPHDPNVLYVTSNHVHRSTDEGMSWEVISPDLTRNDPSKQEASGGPITKDNTGAEVYDTIFAFVESPHEPGVFWAGSDDGLIHLSRDGGQNWTNVTPPDLPPWALISIIEASPHDPATAYVAATRYKDDDYEPYLYKTNDYGQSWTKIVSGIPSNDFTRVIREDPNRRGLLYAGTETSLYISFNDGGGWERFQFNLPVCPIHDLIIKDKDMVVATHGRSFWILDDLSPLYEMHETFAAVTEHLFTPRDTTRFKVYEGYGMESKTEISYRDAGPLVIGYRKHERANDTQDLILLDGGKNPPSGVIVTYWFKEQPEGEVKLSFLDAQGNEIRSFTSKPAEQPSATADGSTPSPVERTEIEGGEKPKTAEEEERKEPRVATDPGLNRFVWDMRYPDATKVPGDKSTEYYLAGPTVVPGSYQVRLSAGGKERTAEFKIFKDPRIEATEQDLQAQFDLLLKIRDKLSATNEAINTTHSARRQVEEWERRAKGHAQEESISGAAKALKEKLTAIERELFEPDSENPRQFPTKLNAMLAALSSFIDMDDARPTRQAGEAYDELAGKIDAQLAALKQVLESDVPSFDRLIRDSGLPSIVPSPEPVRA